MSNIAQSIMQRTFGNQQITNKQFNAAISQGGSLAVNLQYFGQALGWNQQLSGVPELLTGQVAAENKGMSATQYSTLMQQASGGNKSAINQLAKTTGMEVPCLRINVILIPPSLQDRMIFLIVLLPRSITLLKL